jgi:uncharacterized protein (DUF2345 family)
VPHSADALTTIAGRGGIGAIAGQSLHVAAGETLNLGSGQHTNMAVGHQLRLHASQAIGLLAGAHKANGIGLNLIAGKGALNVQAQHDTLALRSKGDLKLVSANAAVEMAAKQKIHLATSQGAFLTIEGGNLTFGCPGKILVQAGNHKLVSATQLSREMNSWGDSGFNDHFQVHYPDGTPAANRAYELTRSDGAKIQGATDANGMIQLQNSVGPDGLDIRFLDDAVQGEA